MTFAITGTLSLKRDDVVKIIKKGGGSFASTVTKKVTHLITGDPDSTSSKIKKAKEDGVKVVGEDFLKNFM